MPAVPKPADFRPPLTLSIIPPRPPAQSQRQQQHQQEPRLGHSPRATNVLLLLHGMGDSHEPFASFGTAINLPETTCLALRAPSPLPLAMPGYHWGDELLLDSRTGRPDVDPGFDRAVALVAYEVVFGVLVGKLGYRLRDVLLLGLGQGAAVALAVALAVEEEVAARERKGRECQEEERAGKKTADERLKHQQPEKNQQDQKPEIAVGHKPDNNKPEHQQSAQKQQQQQQQQTATPLPIPRDREFGGVIAFGAVLPLSAVKPNSPLLNPNPDSTPTPPAPANNSTPSSTSASASSPSPSATPSPNHSTPTTTATTTTTTSSSSFLPPPPSSSSSAANQTTTKTKATATTAYSRQARTPLLLVGGSGPASALADASGLARTRAVFGAVQTVRWPGRRHDGMPRNREEVLPMMQFLARRLRSRAGVPEGSVEVS